MRFPVAEYTLAAILFANKRVFQLNQFYRQHKENRAPWTREAPEVGNYHKTVGIVGASHVGRLVIDYLKPFDLRVLLYDPYVTPLAARELGANKVGLSELLSGSDVVSLHAPLLKDTQHMIGARELSLMRDHSTLINTARGGLLDQDALLAELGQRSPVCGAGHHGARSSARGLAVLSAAQRVSDPAHRRFPRRRKRND